MLYMYTYIIHIHTGCLNFGRADSELSHGPAQAEGIPSNGARAHVEISITEGRPSVFLWALVVGPFDPGGVCSMGPCLVYGI